MQHTLDSCLICKRMRNARPREAMWLLGTNPWSCNIRNVTYKSLWDKLGVRDIKLIISKCSKELYRPLTLLCTNPKKFLRILWDNLLDYNITWLHHWSIFTIGKINNLENEKMSNCPLPSWSKRVLASSDSSHFPVTKQSAMRLLICKGNIRGTH